MLTRLRRALEPVVALVACLAGALVLRLPTLDMPLDRDASVYAVIGRSLGSALPYRDLIDHKQPVVYPVYALLEALAPRSEVAIRLASAVAAGLAAWLLFVGLRPFVGRTRAAVAAGLALVLGASRFVQGFELNTEHLLVLTGTLLVMAALRLSGVRGWWAPFVVGPCAGWRSSPRRSGSSSRPRRSRRSCCGARRPACSCRSRWGRRCRCWRWPRCGRRTARSATS